MVLGYDYPLLGVFWTMFMLFIWLAWFMILFRVVIDVFRSKDMGGFAKAIWVIFVALTPFLGVFVYLVARGRSMSEREMGEAVAQQEAFAAYVSSVAGSGGTADELAKLADLRDRGVIDQAEFDAQKARLLA